MTSHARTFGCILLACLFGPHTALAQAPATTVKIGKETKNIFGTVVKMSMGDIACLVEFKDDKGNEFFESADFDLCTDPKKYTGKRVELAYKLSKVQAESCQGDPNCSKSDIVPLVVGMKVVGKPATLANPVQPAKPATSAKATQPGQTSFCTSMEEVVFACRTGKKMVSVCADKKSTKTTGMLQYRFGTPDSRDPLELMWPENYAAPSKVAHGENVPFAGGGGAWLRIPKGDHAYVVYTGIGKWGPKGETRTKAGLTVEKNGKAIAQLKCNGEPISELGPDWFEKLGVTSAGKDFEFPD
ncbi:MAG: hypothetical protein JNM76_06290 [Betaproteobacteria bacterium]|nr:hypothetical protein [Betaproteobacteria bacterium]